MLLEEPQGKMRSDILSKKNEGKIFEDNWKASYKKLPFYFLRLADAAKWGRGSDSRFMTTNPFDLLHFKPPYLWLLELKSTSDNRISFYPETPWIKPENVKSQPMIKHSQVKSLMESTQKDNTIPGFIINFREKEKKTKTFEHETYFVHINDFVQFAIESKKSSINREECKKIGVSIDSKKKKVNYTYDIEKFCEDSVKILFREKENTYGN
ncbi:hypothetical protein EBB07_28105 [Paenibacillaceae bacterium]|nr:hypothetical protein EBB07_28105 [Paenibacillaceae bacterium]